MYISDARVENVGITGHSRQFSGFNRTSTVGVVTSVGSNVSTNVAVGAANVFVGVYSGVVIGVICEVLLVGILKDGIFSEIFDGTCKEIPS